MSIHYKTNTTLLTLPQKYIFCMVLRTYMHMIREHCFILLKFNIISCSYRPIIQK